MSRPKLKGCVFLLPMSPPEMHLELAVEYIWRRNAKVEAEGVGVHRRGATAGAGFEARRRNLTNERPLDEGVHGVNPRRIRAAACPTGFFFPRFVFFRSFFLNAKSGSLMIYYSVALGIHILYKSIGNGASTQACEKISDFW